MVGKCHWKLQPWARGCLQDAHFPRHTQKRAASLCFKKTKCVCGVGVGGGSFISHDLATGIVPDRLEYTTVSTEGAENEHLLFAAPTVIKTGMKLA